MSRTDIKFCGLNTPESVTCAATLGAAYAGFVFYPRSPRHITPAQAEALKAHLTPHVKTVAVLVDPDDALLGELASTLMPDYWQLHGKESADRCIEVKNRFGGSVIKAFSVQAPGDMENTKAYSSADIFLFDARNDTSPLPGGNGVSFDWDLLAGRTFSLPWMLSGGLNAENVAEAIRRTQAPIVDVSSGIESAPGIKNIEMMKQFAQAVRNA